MIDEHGKLQSIMNLNLISSRLTVQLLYFAVHMCYYVENICGFVFGNCWCWNVKSFQIESFGKALNIV